MGEIMKKRLWQNKWYIFLVLFIMIIGFIIGFIYYHLQPSDIKNGIITTLNSYEVFRSNSIIKDLIITSLLLITSFFIIGIPLALFYLFYESLSIGFLISMFISIYKIKGLFYIFLYLIINKLFSLLLIIFFIRKIIDIERYTIGLFIYKNNSLKEKIIINFISCLYLIVILFVVNIILYFISCLIFSRLTLH